MSKRIYLTLQRLIFGFFFIIVLLTFPLKALAEGEFAHSYKVSYEIESSGETTVTQVITIKNLTDKYYASSFSLSIGSTQLSDISASDTQGPLQVQTQRNGPKTKIDVKFSSQVIGKDKDYKWTLKFKSKDFAQNLGKVWQVSLPRISNSPSMQDYTLILSVPVEFGDPTSLIPDPKSQNESGGRLNFFYDKNQLLESGILANFGTKQLFRFKLGYNLENNKILPAIAKLPLPMDTAYQKVVLEKIDPKPDNVTMDTDGNYIGWFKIDRNQKLKVNVEGLVNLFINKQYKQTSLSQELIQKYTSTDKYWESDSQQIKTKLDEILKNSQATQDVASKARKINKFVSDYLVYDETRLIKSDYERFGALAALLNPDKALCSEFTDLFIALTRGADVPSRALIGYAYTTNKELRPLSLEDSILHAWPEYFDPASGWTMIDPTWQNTTGGVDYFSKFDLNHFVLAIRGSSSNSPVPADEVKVEFTQDLFKAEPKLKMTIDAPSQIFAGFPSQAKVRIENVGNTAYSQTKVSFSAGNLGLSGNQNFTLPTLPPFGFQEYKFDLNSGNLWSSFEDILQLRVGDDNSVNQRIIIKPFFAHKYFSYIVIALAGIMLLIYLIFLIIHLNKKTFNKIQHPK
ncbi:transglutaminase domain-containing protein [Candidatus Daviesbacteria bacterium]|nr:transglutaminase domain-containing protein [Candidatus Daviesbacteria bacterium]